MLCVTQYTMDDSTLWCMERPLAAPIHLYSYVRWFFYVYVSFSLGEPVHVQLCWRVTGRLCVFLSSSCAILNLSINCPIELSENTLWKEKNEHESPSFSVKLYKPVVYNSFARDSHNVPPKNVFSAWILIYGFNKETI